MPEIRIKGSISRPIHRDRKGHVVTEYGGYAVLGYKGLTVADVSVELSSNLLIPFLTKKGRYIGFFDRDGKMIEEHWDTGHVKVDTPSEFNRYFDAYKRAVDEYLLQNGLNRAQTHSTPDIQKKPPGDTRFKRRFDI